MKFKIKSLNFVFSFFLLFIVCGTSKTWAWGQRGHHLICEAASRLVIEEGFKDFMKARGVLLGHLCNIPDIWWRDAEANGKSGDAAHYINPQKLGLRIEEVPLELSALYEMTFKTPMGDVKAQDVDLPTTLGSIWWRANQLFALGIRWGVKAKSSAVPTREEQQNDEHPYNLAVYEMLNAMGIMGHFVGDMGQPYHSDADYDGWAAGHGGIHAYYETKSVDELEVGVLPRILDAAKKEKDFEFDGSSSPALQMMKEIAIRSSKEKKEIEKRDPIVKSSIKKELLDAGVKMPPKRESPAVGAKRFAPLIILQMGRSAKALALMWDEMYRRAGRPNLEEYRSYRYPLKPNFIELDYFPQQKKSL